MQVDTLTDPARSRWLLRHADGAWVIRGLPTEGPASKMPEACTTSSRIYELSDAPERYHLTQEQFDALWEKRPTEEQYCQIYGKTLIVQRRYAVFGKSYQFAGQANEGQEVPEELAHYLGEYGNSILVNWYENGEEYIGYHSDDDRHLRGCVYCFSYGAERRFKFQNKQTKQVDTLMLHNNSLLVMKENTQKTHKHSLPKMKNVGRRISITLRTIV